MKKLIPILLSTLLFTGCASSNNQANTYRSITMDDAVTMMAQETGYIILDVRRPCIHMKSSSLMTKTP